MKILVIGGGNMGLTYARGFLKSHIVDQSNLFILEKSAQKADALRDLSLGTIYDGPGDYVKKMDLIVLAVKPQDIKPVFDTVRPYIDDQQLVLSIMAGVTIETIQQGINTPKVIRAMPNLPAQIGSGMTVYTSSREVTRIELVTVQNLLSASGKTIYAAQEDMLNGATAISGSGPAYVFYFMQSMIEAAQDMGFSYSEAELLTFQTFKGSIDLFNKYNDTCAEWVARVKSKGGTTEAALNSFESTDLSDSFKKGIRQALHRARELSQDQ